MTVRELIQRLNATPLDWLDRDVWLLDFSGDDDDPVLAVVEEDKFDPDGEWVLLLRTEIP